MRINKSTTLKGRLSLGSQSTAMMTNPTVLQLECLVRVVRWGLTNQWIGNEAPHLVNLNTAISAILSNYQDNVELIVHTPRETIYSSRDAVTAEIDVLLNVLEEHIDQLLEQHREPLTDAMTAFRNREVSDDSLEEEPPQVVAHVVDTHTKNNVDHNQ